MEVAIRLFAVCRSSDCCLQPPPFSSISLVRVAMVSGRFPISSRWLLPIAVSAAISAAVSPAEAATCGHYLHTAHNSSPSNRAVANHSLPAGDTASVSRPGDENSEPITAPPVSPCQGARCGSDPATPAVPPPHVRPGQLHELLLAAASDFELNVVVGIQRAAAAAEPADGFPARTKRPPRAPRGLLA